jgi:hypothetical protein
MNFVHCHLDFHHHNIFIFTLISKSMKLVLPRNATVPYVTIILVITNEIASIPILKCSLSYASISAANNIITSTSSSLTTIAINAAELLTGATLFFYDNRHLIHSKNDEDAQVIYVNHSNFTNLHDNRG